MNILLHNKQGQAMLATGILAKKQNSEYQTKNIQINKFIFNFNFLSKYVNNIAHHLIFINKPAAIKISRKRRTSYCIK